MASAHQKAWDRLERIAWRIHGHGVEAASGSPGLRLRRFRSMLRDCVVS